MNVQLKSEYRSPVGSGIQPEKQSELSRIADNLRASIEVSESSVAKLVSRLEVVSRSEPQESPTGKDSTPFSTEYASQLAIINDRLIMLNYRLSRQLQMLEV